MNISQPEQKWASALLSGKKGTPRERQFAAQAEDRARGAANLPLSGLGKLQADHLGARIAAKGGIDTIATSSLDRARETTGAILAHNPNAKLVDVSHGLEPWHQGAIEGMPSEQAKPHIAFYARHPNVKIPGVGLSGVPGESLNDFLGRSFGYLHKNVIPAMHPGERRLLLGHHSLIRAIHGLRRDGSVDPEAMVGNDNADPSDVFRIQHDGQRVHGLDPINMDSDEQDFAKPGLFVGRHGATAFNKESYEPKMLAKLNRSSGTTLS